MPQSVKPLCLEEATYKGEHFTANANDMLQHFSSMLQLIKQSWGKKAVGTVPVPLTVR